MNKNDEMERIRAAVRRAMERKGIKPKPLSISAGLGPTAVRDLLERTDDVRMSTLRKLAVPLETDVDELIGVGSVVLAGRIGAGGSVAYADMGRSDLVPRPAGLSGALEALEVVGDSMLPRYSSGDIVYISRRTDGVLAEYIGEYCAARLTTGETYIKLLARGSRPGFYTLRSLNAADIEDVELEWATPILSVLPRLARKMLGF